MPGNATTTLPQPSIERALWRMVGAKMEADELNAERLAPKVGLHRSQIDRYLQGVRTAPFAVADKIVRELGWDSLMLAMAEARALEAERASSDAEARYRD